MTAKEDLKQRHNLAALKLKDTATPVIEKKGLLVSCSEIAKTLGVSYQTIVNYTYGRVKDGFLAEAITKEFKKLK